MKAVDLFAGFGGFTLGAERAGARVVWASNHWPLAVRAHAANHPHTEHTCQDLRQADWRDLPAYDLLLASPACQGHTEAAQPQRKRLAHVASQHATERATAWAVVDCVEVTRPRALIVENVLPFRRWELFDLWCEALRRFGYTLDVRVETASHHGVPQRRRRLIVVGLRNGRTIAPTPRAAEPAFGPCVEWDAGEWRPLSAMAPGARDRLAKGRARLGARFIGQHVTGHPGVPLHEPIRTITCADQWFIVDGHQYRPLTVRETARAMGFPDDYRWPDDATREQAIDGLGNAVCPPKATAIVRAVMEAA